MPLLTQEEVAERLGVSVRTLMRMRQDGRIRFLRTGEGVGTRIRFTGGHIREFIERHEQWHRPRREHNASEALDDLNAARTARLIIRDIRASAHLKEAKAAGDTQEIGAALTEKAAISRLRSELRRRRG